MLKFIVYVNSKFMVKIEADSALSAEHMILEIYGCKTALAFNLEDKEECSTETFRSCMLFSEFVSMDELKSMSDAICSSEEEIASICKARKNVLNDIEEFDRRIAELQDCKKALMAQADALIDRIEDAQHEKASAHYKLCSEVL